MYVACASDDSGAISYDSGVAEVDLRWLDEPTRPGVPVGLEITRQSSSLCTTRSKSRSLSKSIDWKEELRAKRIRAQVIYSNLNRRQAEQVEAALQRWDLTQNKPAGGLLRFSLHQRWAGNFAAKPCADHEQLVEVTTAFFEKRCNAVFVLQASGFRVGKGGEVL